MTIKGSFKMTIEVIVRYQFFQRHIDQWSKASFFSSHHGATHSSSALLVSSHLFRFLDGSGGRNHSETWEGCIVSSTTATSCSRNWCKSTSLRNVALKAARVRAASYFRRKKRRSMMAWRRRRKGWKSP